MLLCCAAVHVFAYEYYMNALKYRTLAEFHECTCILKVQVDWTVDVLSVTIRSL